MGFFSEFREFAVKGNVIDLAVGVVIGTAFGAITSSLVKDVIMPPLGLIISRVDFTKLKLTLKEAEMANGAVVAEAVTLNYGAFLQTIINFLIISFAIFLMVRTINRYRRKEAAKPAPPINKQEVLLAEIRDILKSKPLRDPMPLLRRPQKFDIVFPVMPRLLLILFFYVILFSVTTGGASAQEMKPDSVASAWAFGGSANLNFSQVSVNNWAAGGQNSMSVLGMTNLVANYKRGKNTWNNSLGLTLGYVKLEKQSVRKSDDRLEINVKYGRETSSKKWFYSGQLNLKSQLTPTFNTTKDTIVSNFLSPGFILLSAGMDYKPSPRLSVFVSTVTGKFTVVLSQELADIGAFGVRPAWKGGDIGRMMPGTGQRFRKELGGYVNVRYTDKVFDNVTIRSKLDLFSNYLNNPQNVDVNWENIVDFKVNKFISANLFCHLIYDDDILIKVDTTGDGVLDGRGPRLQVRETLGVGFAYKFN